MRSHRKFYGYRTVRQRIGPFTLVTRRRVAPATLIYRRPVPLHRRDVSGLQGRFIGRPKHACGLPDANPGQTWECRCGRRWRAGQATGVWTYVGRSRARATVRA